MKKTDPENREKVVWNTHAGTLIKGALEQLRYPSERARQLANMGQAQRLSWTHESLDGWLRKGQYEDLTTDAPPDEDETDDELEGLEDDSSAAWEHETRQVKRKLELQPSSSRSLERPRGEEVLSQTFAYIPMQAEKTCAQSVPEPNEILKTRITCSFPEHGPDEQRITTKAFREQSRTVRGKPTEKKKSRGERGEPFTR